MPRGSGPLRLGGLLAVAVQGGENTADIGGRPCTLVVRVVFDTPPRLHRFHLFGTVTYPTGFHYPPAAVGNGGKPRSGAVITASARRRLPRGVRAERGGRRVLRSPARHAPHRGHLKWRLIRGRPVGAGSGLRF
jgi:hypothetical protein